MGVYVGDSLVAGNVGEVYTKAQVDTMIANAVALAEPVGSIKPFAGTTVPDGYLLCDGSAISRTTYAALFAVIGTTYGTGDGSTTFNLPNMVNYLPRMNGSNNIGATSPGWAPNIKGSVGHDSGIGHVAGVSFGVSVHDSSLSGAFFGGASCNYSATERNQRTNGKALGFDASRSSSVYNSDVSQVMCASIVMNYFIKY